MQSRFGILAAMPQEVAELSKHVTGQREHKRGSIFTFVTGELDGKPVVYAAANVGMVFAASAATTMIGEFGASALLFTGVAGGLRPGQKIGDIVIGEDVVNYEMDCRAFSYAWDPEYKLQLGEMPFVGWRFFEADAALLALALEAPRPEGFDVVKGRIATGSVFLSAHAKQSLLERVWEPLGRPLCAEMENAGVAQVCRAYGVPYVSLRALSDLLTGDASADFNAFCEAAANHLVPIVRYVVQRYSVNSVGSDDDVAKAELRVLKEQEAAEMATKAKADAEKAKKEEAEEAANQACAEALEKDGKRVAGGVHKFDASEVDVHGGDATADDLHDAFGI